MSVPGFTAEDSIGVPGNRYVARSRYDGGLAPNTVVASVPMVYCKYVCKWRVCGSALPGYPVPMCYSCEQECWIHDSGRYSSSLSTETT